MLIGNYSGPKPAIFTLSLLYPAFYQMDIPHKTGTLAQHLVFETGEAPNTFENS